MIFSPTLTRKGCGPPLCSLVPPRLGTTALNHVSDLILFDNKKLSVLKVIHSHFSTSVYLRDNATVNPLQGQCLYWMIIPHCLFILPADVISSCWLRPLTCHLPPIVAVVYSTVATTPPGEHPCLYLGRIPAYRKVSGVSKCKICLYLKVTFV